MFREFLSNQNVSVFTERIVLSSTELGNRHQQALMSSKCNRMTWVYFSRILVSYHWRFTNGNNTVQLDDNANSTAVMQGSVVNAEEEYLVIEKGGYITTSNIISQNNSLTVSFWMKQEGK